MTTDNLTVTNKEYDYHKSNWKLVRDLIKGEKAIKTHDLRAAEFSKADATNIFIHNSRYIPIPNPTDASKDNQIRYAQMVNRASLFNATKRTREAMTGMVTSKPAEIEFPEAIAYLEEDVDGSGTGIESQAITLLDDIEEVARGGLFVDYPETDGPLTQKDVEEKNIRATINLYKAESILDWDTITVNSKQLLSFVKLLEIYTKREGMITTCENRYRILTLDEDGFYHQLLESESGDILLDSNPTDKNGNKFSEIPFFFVGAVNNKPNIDTSPLLELAELNIAHYRNSADFEQSAFLVGQPTPWASGLTQSWVDENFKDGVNLGSSSFIPLPVNASMGLLQVNENTSAERGMDRKEKQMIKLGARLIVDGGENQTAEAARIKHASDASVLSRIVKNINEAYDNAIAVAQMFNSGLDQEYLFKLNENFFSNNLSPDMLRAQVEAFLQNALPLRQLINNLKAGGIISAEEDSQSIIEEIENTPSTGLDLDDNTTDTDQ